MKLTRHGIISVRLRLIVSEFQHQQKGIKKQKIFN